MSTNEDAQKRRAFRSYAFHNLVNYAALVGITATALATGAWWLLVVGAAAEGAWLLTAPRSRALARRSWERRWAAHQKRLRRQLRDRHLASLGPADWQRCRLLEQRRSAIERHGRDHPAFPRGTLDHELEKLDELTGAFVELAVSAVRLESHLATSTGGDLEAERARYEAQLRHARTDSDRALAEQNLRLVTRRQQLVSEIQQQLRQTRGQLDLIENSFGLLADQIMTMRSPAELGGRLDDLLEGVETLRLASQETDLLLEPPGRAQP